MAFLSLSEHFPHRGVEILHLHHCITAHLHPLGSTHDHLHRTGHPPPHHRNTQLHLHVPFGEAASSNFPCLLTPSSSNDMQVQLLAVLHHPQSSPQGLSFHLLHLHLPDLLLVVSSVLVSCCCPCIGPLGLPRGSW